MKAATKINKPLFGEDGVERGLLEKYDEEAAEEGLVLDDSGRALEERRRQDIRAKLALGAAPSRVVLRSGIGWEGMWKDGTRMDGMGWGGKGQEEQGREGTQRERK